jgi:hypothetical protein
MKRALALLAGAALAATYASRNELRRYLRIRRMGSDPSLVGQSVTPQGNQKANHHH